MRFPRIPWSGRTGLARSVAALMVGAAAAGLPVDQTHASPSVDFSVQIGYGHGYRHHEPRRQEYHHRRHHRHHRYRHQRFFGYTARFQALDECHPVAKDGYDLDGRPARIGGTLCYDYAGDGYIVPGSRYILDYY